MGAVRSRSNIAVALLFGVGALLLQAESAVARDDVPERMIMAQTSMGGPEPMQPQTPPVIEPPAPALPPPAAPVQPPSYTPSEPQSNASPEMYWGAIAFTADGSWSSAWKKPTRSDAEAIVLRQCARFGHGNCDVATISGEECVGLASFIGNYRGRRWMLSFTAGGTTFPEAQAAAMDRCNSDERTRGRCLFRTAACADGR
jgi:hypothetical protein